MAAISSLTPQGPTQDAAQGPGSLVQVPHGDTQAKDLRLQLKVGATFLLTVSGGTICSMLKNNNISCLATTAGAWTNQTHALCRGTWRQLSWRWGGFTSPGTFYVLPRAGALRGFYVTCGRGAGVQEAISQYKGGCSR